MTLYASFRDIERLAARESIVGTLYKRFERGELSREQFLCACIVVYVDATKSLSKAYMEVLEAAPVTMVLRDQVIPEGV